MNTLDLIIARTNLSMTIEKMKNTLLEIENKTPHKVDLIQSMSKTISELTFSYVFFCDLEAEFRAARQRNGDLEFSRFKDSEELNRLREQNKQLLEML